MDPFNARVAVRVDVAATKEQRLTPCRVTVELAVGQDGSARARLVTPRDRDVSSNVAASTRSPRPKASPPDALIAATALEHGFNLATRNEADFAPETGLRIRALG